MLSSRSCLAKDFGNLLCRVFAVSPAIIAQPGKNGGNDPSSEPESSNPIQNGNIFAPESGGKPSFPGAVISVFYSSPSMARRQFAMAKFLLPMP